ncbi:UDP-glycosyltransferase 89C1-like [Gossypium australe]|uniref:UDP-glycosyltransferase 89C1-like n=1 Tax=Gossypium australe TaxID=47621 RepID=A0A5B6WNX5_9ROSI|nr:UDP-glycosyltransferase 89C1-like [Gossypium australe]
MVPGRMILTIFVGSCESTFIASLSRKLPIMASLTWVTYKRTSPRDFTDGEILEAFKLMDPCKALGIDSLSGIFFKKNWKVVSKEVINFCHDVLNRNKDNS